MILVIFPTFLGTTNQIKASSTNGKYYLILKVTKSGKKSPKQNGCHRKKRVWYCIVVFVHDEFHAHYYICLIQEADKTRSIMVKLGKNFENANLIHA